MCGVRCAVVCAAVGSIYVQAGDINWERVVDENEWQLNRMSGRRSKTKSKYLELLSIMKGRYSVSSTKTKRQLIN